MKQVLSCIVGALVTVAFAGLVPAAEHPASDTVPANAHNMKSDTGTSAQQTKKAQKTRKAKKATRQMKEGGTMGTAPQTAPAPLHAPPHAPADQ
jgi:hypothetical protein